MNQAPRIEPRSDIDRTVRPAPIFTENLGEWFVLHTKSRQEKALGAELDRLGVPYYLPIVNQIRYYGKRKFKVAEPLFPGYIFLRGSTEGLYTADRTKRVANIIQVEYMGPNINQETEVAADHGQDQ